MNCEPRIALVAPAFFPAVGGVETHVAQLALHLAAAGGDVVVLTCAGPDVISERGAVEDRDGYRIERFPLPVASTSELPSPALLRAVRRHARQGGIVHAHNYHALTFLGAAFVTPGSQLVLTPHYHGVGRTGLRTAAHQVYRPAGLAALRRAAAVLAVSGSEADLLRQDFGGRVAGRTRVVPNGARVLPGTARTLTRPTVFTWGRLEDYKRVDLLVRALTQLPDVELVVGGAGPALSSLGGLAADLGVTSQVRLLGRVSDDELGDWLASDVLVAAPSTIEAFGLTMADALASGRPVAASPIEAHRDVAALAGPDAAVTFLPRSGSDAAGDPSGLPAAVAGVLAEALNRGEGQRRRSAPSPLPTWPMVAGQVAAVYASLPAPSRR